MRPVGLSLAPLNPPMHRCVDQRVQMPQEGGFEPADLGLARVHLSARPAGLREAGRPVLSLRGYVTRGLWSSASECGE
jgi:hypothetical protein